MPSLFKAFRRRSHHTGPSATSSGALMHSPSMLSNTSTTSAFSPHRHQYSIRVALLDDRVIQLNYTKNDDASHLFNRVCDEEQIGSEKDWFGLRFIDSHGQPHWLDMHKNARAQLKKGLPNSVHYRSLLEGSGESSDGRLKVSPSKSSMYSGYSNASATLPRQSSGMYKQQAKSASPSAYDQQYRDTESFTSQSNATLGSLNEGYASTTGIGDNVSELQFRFKFYPQNPTHALQEESTRYALVKQLRSDFRVGKLTGSVTDESKIIACLLQADLGNLREHQAKIHPNTTVNNNSSILMSDFVHPTPPMPARRTVASAATTGSGDVSFTGGSSSGTLPSSSAAAMLSASPIPDVYREMNHFGNTGEEKILSEWAACADATPAECDTMLLNVASQLESYGIADATPVHDQQTDRDAMLGCNYAGILVRNATRRINAFAWQKIQKVNLDGKLIVLYVLDSDGSITGGTAGAATGGAASNVMNGGAKSPIGSDETSKYAYKCRSGSGAKALWKLVLENKIFYSAPSSKGIAPVRSGRAGPLSFHRRVTLRFSGRTAREAIEQGVKRKQQQTNAPAGNASPPQPPVQRLPLAATYTMPDTLRAATAPGAAAASGSGEWSSSSNSSTIKQHELIGGDKQLKLTLYDMQAQTYNIADELLDIRSPNTVGADANKRPHFAGPFSPDVISGGVDGVFQLHPLNSNSNDTAELQQQPPYRFCTVGDVPDQQEMMPPPHAHSTPRNVAVLTRDGNWVDADDSAVVPPYSATSSVLPPARDGGSYAGADRDDERTVLYRPQQRSLNDSATGYVAVDGNNNDKFIGRERMGNSNDALQRNVISRTTLSGRQPSKLRTVSMLALTSLLGCMLVLSVLSLVVYETTWLDGLLHAVGVVDTGRESNVSRRRFFIDHRDESPSMLQQLIVDYKHAIYDRTHGFVWHRLAKYITE